ncbi:MAG: long-chain acyl-CoA synthetase [Acidimicrobiaceae bacterium]
MAIISNEEIARAVEGDTLAAAFLRTLRTYPNRVALRQRAEDGSYDEWTFAEYAQHVSGAAAHLRSLGVGPGDRVVLMMRNCVDFHLIDLAVVFCDATAISIYNSSSPEQVAYLAGHCKAKVAVVEDDGFLERFAKVRDQLPDLEHIINLADDGVPDALFHGGTFDLEAGASAVTPDTLATVIYTSGTTGPPKGVMLSHYNVMWTCESLRRSFGDDIDLTGFRLVSYLPMAHIAERATSHYQQIINAFEVTSCPDFGLIASYLKDVRPNIMFGVPRVWEKLHAGLTAALASDPTKKTQFDAAVEMAKPISIDRAWERSTPEQDATWQALQDAAFGPMRAAIGLEEIRFAISGAAPIARELLEWYNAIGVPLSEIYGMSESSGPMTWAPVHIKPGTVGPAIPGCEVKLAADGEVICKGGNVFIGYLDDPEKTAESLDDDDWLHSGDIGEVDDDGYFRIVDRKKELIITAGGKNVSPANLEAVMKSVELVGQAIAIGDNKPFIAALVVLDPEVAPAWAKREGIEFTSLADLADNPAVVAEVEREVKEAMKQFNSAEQVKKVKVLGEEWLPDSEELTPTSKLKRRGVHAKYASEIAALYS